MEGDPEFVVLKNWAWLDAEEFEDIMLGAIVDEFLSPTTGYVPDSDPDPDPDPSPDPASAAEPAPAKQPPLKRFSKLKSQDGTFTDFVAESSFTDGKAAELALTKLARVNFTGSTDEAINLSGRFIRFRRIQQLDKFWKNIKQDSEVKDTVSEWLEKKRRWPVCLVTGVMICEDAEISSEGHQSREVEGGVELPLGEILLAAGVPNVLGSAADPKANVSSARKKATIFRAKVPNARVFALELKKVTNGAWYKRELTLSNDGPAVKGGRVWGVDEDEDGPVDPADEELILEDIEWTPEEREAMA